MWSRLLIMLCLLPCTIIAQQSSFFVEKLTMADGLGSNKINDIAQDRDGFLWIATSDGLNRFDGTEIVKYYHYNNSNSIPHNYVYCLKMLSHNHLAIGTQGGLSFYNAATGHFRNFYYRCDNRIDEYNNTIVGIETDVRGNCWAYSRNCIFIFDTLLRLKKIVPSSYTESDIVGKRMRFVEKIFPLSNGDILLYASTGWQIYSAETGEITAIENSVFKNRLGFLRDGCSDHLIGSDQYFPAATLFKVYDKYFLRIEPCADSLVLFDEQGQRISSCFFPYNKYPYVLWSQRASVIDRSTILFSLHNYGMAIIPVSWEDNKPTIHRPSRLLFEMSEYGNALQDRQGNWWLTTGEGLQKISPQKQYFKSNLLINTVYGRAVRYDINSIVRQQHTLWVSTYGEGFFEIDLLSGRQQQHTLAKKAKNDWADFIWNIRLVTPDTLWVGTQAGMFWYTISNKKAGRIPPYPGKPSVLDSVPITTQFTDSHGLVWMGLGRGKGVCYYDKNKKRFTYYPAGMLNGYPFRYPLGIAEDNKANLWFVSDAGTGLTYYDRRNNSFRILSLPFKFRQQAGGLNSILYESDSIIWLGTATGGLIKFNPSANSLSIYGHDHGLVNSHISSIYKDRFGKLWLGTDGGLSSFDPNAGLFTNYTVKEGLPSQYLSGNFYYDTAQERLYIGGKGNLIYFNPDSMNFTQPPQRTIIIGMQVNGKAYNYISGPAKFTAKENNITIHYTAIDMLNGPSTKYAYQLLGEDSAWIMLGDQRQINFSRLAPGKYKFMVRASNSRGNWSSESASISFSIRRPFSQTVWFYLVIILATGILFYAMYLFRLRQLMRTEQIRSEISKNLHDEVGSTLTNISFGSLLAQKQLANEEDVSKILDRIYQDSQNISETMREIVWSINPRIDTLGEALPRMLRYASELLEAKNIELQAEIASGIEQVKLSMKERRDIYLIFKEAVNNLAKHSKASNVKIGFHLTNAALVMTIADNGMGFNNANSYDSNGLKNMQERAMSHRWQLTIQSVQGTGTNIVLKAQIA